VAGWCPEVISSHDPSGLKGNRISKGPETGTQDPVTNIFTHDRILSALGIVLIELCLGKQWRKSRQISDDTTAMGTVIR